MCVFGGNLSSVYVCVRTGVLNYMRAYNRLDAQTVVIIVGNDGLLTAKIVFV